MSSTSDLATYPAEQTFRARFVDNLERLNHAQKSGAGVPAYTRWINRRLARSVAAAATALGLGPNAVSVASAATSACGLALLIVLEPRVIVGVLVAVLLAAGYVLDSADGQVARLSRRSSPVGEWLDHVIDSMRTPAIHLCVAAATYLHREQTVVMAVALAFAVVSCGQFMSQILAGQLADDRTAGTDDSPGLRQSVVLLPTDTGVLCWLFLLWGLASSFAVAYVALFVLCSAHAGVSMHRKYVKLRALGPTHPTEAGRG